MAEVADNGVDDDCDPTSADDDVDGDAVLNSEDNCMSIANTDQEDIDDDGVGDDSDPRQEGHHDTKQGEHKAEGSMGAGGVEGVTGAILNTSEIWH